MSLEVTTPSRLCLFGEHLDYLKLEVITLAIDLRFSAAIEKRNDHMAYITIRDEKSTDDFVTFEYDLKKPLVYDNSRDYFKSCFNVLKKRGYDITSGFDIRMDSNIPIGKGMCSSSTMIVALLKALLEVMDADIKNDKKELAELAYQAEVVEFNEPGGKMDHIASVFGGICHFDFTSIDNPKVEKLNYSPQGTFILFDSLDKKDTIKVLSNARKPVEEALSFLRSLGVEGIRQIYREKSLPDRLPKNLLKPLNAAIDNYSILKTFLDSLKNSPTSEYVGSLIYKHHTNLRDGLNISTDKIERILDKAMELGAYGGKINGSGGGGCCFVFTPHDKAMEIYEKIQSMGYPGRILKPAEGTKVTGGNRI